MVKPWLRKFSFSKLIAVIAAIFAFYLAITRPVWLPPDAIGAAALVVLALGLWATSAVPEHLTALGFFLLAMLFNIAPPEVIFSGFESTALWLVFGGLIVSVAVRHAGLDDRLSFHIASRLHGSYAGVIGGMIALGTALAFFMPSSMGRILIIAPIAEAVAARFGFREGSTGRTGVVLAAVFGTSLPAFAILPANLANAVLMGSAETLYGIRLEYGEYLFLHFPVLGILRGLGLLFFILLMFPAKPDERRVEALTERGMSLKERLVMSVVFVSVGLWMTDSLHQISPAWVALGAGLICLIPQLRLVSPDAFNREINYASIFLVAGIVGLGKLVAISGLGEFLSREILQLLPLSPGHPAQNFAALSLTAVATGIISTTAGTPAILTPLAGELASASALPLKTVIMTQVIGISTVVLPYQIAPIIVGMKIAGEALGPAMRLCFVLALFGIFVLIPIDYFWFRALGWL